MEKWQIAPLFKQKNIVPQYNRALGGTLTLDKNIGLDLKLIHLHIIWLCSTFKKKQEQNPLALGSF